MAKMTKPTRRKRARKPEADVRGTMTVRLSKQLRRALDKAAGRSMTSLGKEVERRLRDSFSRDYSLDANNDLYRSFGGSTTFALLREVGNMAGNIMHEAGHDWTRDPWTFAAVMTAAVKFLEKARPEGSITRPADLPAFIRTPEEMGEAEAFRRHRQLKLAVLEEVNPRDDELHPGPTVHPTSSTQSALVTVRHIGADLVARMTK
jgi:hypothetical protein